MRLRAALTQGAPSNVDSVHFPTPRQTCLKIITAAVRAAKEAESMDPVLSTMPLVPMALGGLLVCAPLLLFEINSSLAAAQASYAIPVYKSLNIVNGPIVGGFVWHEFDGEPFSHMIMFLIGMVTIVSSVTLLSCAEVEAERQRLLPMNYCSSSVSAKAPLL
jgi:hypothetical protein|eukprot:4034819-Prymnesium_polylepis.1